MPAILAFLKIDTSKFTASSAWSSNQRNGVIFSNVSRTDPSYAPAVSSPSVGRTASPQIDSDGCPGVEGFSRPPAERLRVNPRGDSRCGRSRTRQLADVHAPRAVHDDEDSRRTGDHDGGAHQPKAAAAL